MELNGLIKQILDTPTRHTVELANRYLENSETVVQGFIQGSHFSKDDMKQLQLEIGRAHGKIAEARSISHLDDATKLILLRLEAHAFYLSGVGELADDKAKAAIKHFQDCVFIEKDYAAGHFWLGQAFMRAGQREQAFEMFQTAIVLDPDNIDYREHWDKVKGTSKFQAFTGTKGAETAARGAIIATKTAGKVIEGTLAASAWVTRAVWKGITKR